MNTPLKLSGDVAETISSGREFQRGTTIKKKRIYVLQWKGLKSGLELGRRGEGWVRGQNVRWNTGSY